MRFDGWHYETGALRNALRVAGEDLSEGFLLGASGGIALGYFIFEYKGWLPHVALLGRNTFDPFEKMLDRLGIQRDERQTDLPKKAEQNLRDALDEGHKPLVWADVFSLAQSAAPTSMPMWHVQPMLVVGIEGDDALVVNQSAAPIAIPLSQLSAARSRVKKHRHRQMVVLRTTPDRHADAAREGIAETIRMFTGQTPAGAAHNFGFGAFDQLIEMLTNQRNKASWARVFDDAPKLFQALMGTRFQPGLYSWISAWGSPGFDRPIFADFLGQVATMLDRPELGHAGRHFTTSATMWQELALDATPDDVPCLAEARRIATDYRRERFETGRANVDLADRWKALANSAEIPADIAHRIKHDLRERLIAIRDIEKQAIDTLNIGS